MKAHGYKRKEISWDNLEKIVKDMLNLGDVYIIEGGASDWTFFKGER